MAYPRHREKLDHPHKDDEAGGPWCSRARTTTSVAPDVGLSTDACQKGQSHRAAQTKRRRNGG
eukprot:7834089-Pyramimonas_sp.AAC.1